jgi:hypothetical protein
MILNRSHSTSGSRKVYLNSVLFKLGWMNLNKATRMARYGIYRMSGAGISDNYAIMVKIISTVL